MPYASEASSAKGRYPQLLAFRLEPWLSRLMVTPDPGFPAGLAIGVWGRKPGFGSPLTCVLDSTFSKAPSII